MSRLRVTINGFLPAATRWDTDYLGFNGGAAKRSIGDVLANWMIDSRGEYSAVSDWMGGSGFDVVPEVGRVRRSGYVGVSGVAGRRMIRDGSFLFFQVNSATDFSSYFHTDTPLGTDGIGTRRTTGDVLQMAEITGVVGDETGWRRF